MTSNSSHDSGSGFQYTEGFCYGYDYGRSHFSDAFLVDAMFSGQDEFVRGYVHGCKVREASEKEQMKALVEQD